MSDEEGGVRVKGGCVGWTRWRHGLKKKRAGCDKSARFGPMFGFRSLRKFRRESIDTAGAFSVEGGRISIMKSVVVRQGVGISRITN